MVDQPKAFISYRREHFERARLVRDGLAKREIDAFLDVDELRAGRFDERILGEISARDFFVPVLARGSLLRCRRKGDWLWRELEHAYRGARTFVPVLSKDFDERELRPLPPELQRTIQMSQSIRLDDADLFDARLERLATFIKDAPQPGPATKLGPALRQPRRPSWHVGAAVAGIIGAFVAFLIVTSLADTWPFSGPSSSPTTIPFSTISSSPASISPDATTDPTESDVAAPPVNELRPNEELHAGQTRTSTNGRHVLTITDGGVLELRSQGQLVWNSDQPGVPNSFAVMQSDGNLVIHPPADADDVPDPLWDLKSCCHTNAYLVVDEAADGTGYIAIVSPDGSQLLFRKPDAVAPLTTESPNGSPPATESSAAASLVVVPTLIGRELTEVMDELKSRGLVPIEQVQTDPQYRYVVVDASEDAGAQLAAGSTVNLTPDFDSTTLSFFPSGLGPGSGGQIAIGPTCSNGTYEVPELSWSGTNVVGKPTLAITSSSSDAQGPSSPPAITRTVSTTESGRFSGKVSSFVVGCSNTGTVIFDLQLTATGPQTTGEPADPPVKAVYKITITNPQVNG